MCGCTTLMPTTSPPTGTASERACCAPCGWWSGGAEDALPPKRLNSLHLCYSMCNTDCS